MAIVRRKVEVGAVQLGDAGDDREAQAAARLASLIQPVKTAQYGIQVVSLQSVFGKWQFILHPLWTHEPSQTNSLLAFEPSQLEYRYALDTQFEEDIHYGKGGGTGLDGKEEGYITEAGLSFYHPELFLYMENVGQDSLLSS
ncbi:MAG: hypothetical protein BWY63_03152 [Chloroflexi bacterium ADurb.Bin360]|nr:MAG: hypothetical protein BWY63_03152 [Chloroflexi bacterium ADurb.Bin360]